MKTLAAIILAGGQGKRLADAGIAPLYEKPLIRIDGEPLIQRVYNQVASVQPDDIIVITAPSNTESICRLLPNDATVIVQTKPLGPAHALRLGLMRTNAEYGLMAASDNVFDETDIPKCVLKLGEDSSIDGVIGTGLISPLKANRFSRFENSRWIEDRKHPKDTSNHATVWSGPLIVRKNLFIESFTRRYKDVNLEEQEALIGPLLNDLGKLEPVMCSSHDIGVPEVWV